MADDPVASLMAALEGKRDRISALRAGRHARRLALQDRADRQGRVLCPPAASISTAACSGLDTSSNVVPASGLHGDRNYADQAAVSRPGLAARSSRGSKRRQASCASATGTTASRSAPRRAGCSPNWSSAPTRSATTSMVGHEYEYYLLVGGDEGAAVRGHPHLPYRAQPVHAVPRPARADAARLRHRRHHPQLRVCAARSSRPVYGAGHEHRRPPTRPSPSRTA